MHGLLLLVAIAALVSTRTLSGDWYYQYQSSKTTLPDVQALQQ